MAEEEEEDGERNNTELKMKAEAEVRSNCERVDDDSSNCSSMSFFDSLPDEQGLEIFKYLDAGDLSVVAQVCKLFLRWSSDDSLWRPLYLKYVVANVPVMMTLRTRGLGIGSSSSSSASGGIVTLPSVPSSSSVWRFA